jgi:hypothetical protein
MEDESVILLDMNAVFEDDPSAIGLEQSAAYFGVFDGHGGTAAAHFAAKHLHFNIGRSSGWNRSSAARGSHGSHRRTSTDSESRSENSADMAWDSCKTREHNMIAGIAEGFLVRPPNLQYQLHTRPHMLIATVFSSRGLAFRLISLAKSLGLFCVCGRVLWVSIVDGRTISEQSTAIKLIFWHNRLRRHHPGPLAVLCKPWRLEGSLVP